MPFEHYIGRLCEEFGCLPSAAYDELMRLPCGMLEQIVEYRSFAATYWGYRRQQHPQEESEMLRLVKRIEAERAAAVMGIEFRPDA